HTVELKDYWRTLRRRWKTVVACLLIAVAAAAALTLRATPQYASTAQLFVSTSQSETSGDAYSGRPFASQRVSSYADMVSSHRLAERVNDALGADYEPEELAEKVSATVTPETVLLEVTATDEDPEVARNIAQAYAEALASMVRDLETPEG